MADLRRLELVTTGVFQFGGIELEALRTSPGCGLGVSISLSSRLASTFSVSFVTTSAFCFAGGAMASASAQPARKSTMKPRLP